jgi:hypothetical protein
VFQTGKVTYETKHELFAFRPVNQAEVGLREKILKDFKKYYKKLPLPKAAS